MTINDCKMRGPDRTNPAEAPAASAYALYRQQVGTPFRRLYFRQPVLIAVTRGHKSIGLDRLTLDADAGSVVVTSAGCFADVTNTPDAGGLYEADVFAFGADLIPHAKLPPPGTLRFGRFTPPAEFSACVSAAREALAAKNKLPARVVAHRVGELLAWAREFGIVPTFADPGQLQIRVRAVVSANPARDWRIAEIASALAMSEPTLRRHLAEEGTTPSDIIADIRLTRALEQLQTTDASVTQIALDAGYESSSRFAAKFRARFGLAPGEIRGRRPKNDRIRTEFERTSVAAG
jgi:AraC-like DNA-binding protein